MNKVKEYILLKIKEEIENSIIECSHGINNKNVYEHLINPIKEKYIGFNENDIFFLWTVLEEIPKKKDGYTVFFDEECSDFGLGIHTDKGLMYLGNYGSFIKTLQGM